MCHEVFAAMNQQRIHDLALELLESMPGSLHYLSGYSRAHSQIEGKLTEEQCQKYRMMAKEWSEKKLPPGMQKQYVHSNYSSKLGLADCSKLV